MVDAAEALAHADLRGLVAGGERGDDAVLPCGPRARLRRQEDVRRVHRLHRPRRASRRAVRAAWALGRPRVLGRRRAVGGVGDSAAFEIVAAAATFAILTYKNATALKL